MGDRSKNRRGGGGGGGGGGGRGGNPFQSNFGATEILNNQLLSQCFKST